ncbi:MAG: Na-translocating system protein MpsC family protein [Bacillota bacterium]
MPVKGKIEEEITNAMIKLQKEQTGRGGDGESFIIKDLVLVRLKEVLTPAERQLARDPEGKRLIKDLRSRLEAITRPALEDIIHQITGLRVVSVHSDISTKTGERIDVFVLEDNLEMKLNHKGSGCREKG